MIGIEANEERRETELSSQEHIIFMHFVPRLPNKEVPSLYKALLAPLRQRVTLDHPDAHVRPPTRFGVTLFYGRAVDSNLFSDRGTHSRLWR